MTKLKIGTNVKNYEDVKNLIIGLINRLSEFDISLLVRLTNNYIQGSSLKITTNELMFMTDNVLDLLQKNNYVSCSNGTYKSRNFLKNIDEYYKLREHASIIL